MTDSHVQKHSIPLSQDDLQAKWVSQKWDDRFSPEDCQSTEKTVTFDNWRTSTVIKRKAFHNDVTGHRAITREFSKDGKLIRIVLRLEDETGIYAYNGIPVT